MPGPSRKVSQPTGWRSADGSTAPPQIGPRRRWQPGEDPGRPRRTGRAVKIAAVAAGLLAAAGGLGYLASILFEPNPPQLVVVGADPAQDCLRLDVPPDYAGWTTGRQLIRWGRAEEAAGKAGLTARVVASATDPDAPVALPADDAGLADFAGRLVGNRFARRGRVLVYLGLHGGVDKDDRPFLWVGKGDRLAVGTLLARLADTLAKREVVVLFDAGRLAPDPLVGRLADGFADRLAKDDEVKAALARHKKMVLVCGCSPGEVGWESEELQATAFGHAVLRGLRGEFESAKGAIRADELIAFVKTTTEAWTAGNRPTRQTPLVLDGGDGRAAGMVAGYRRDDPAPAAAPDPYPLDGVAGLWLRHDALAQKVPAPASYTPLAWRRGRELLLRYQQAARAGERGAAGRLEQAVADEFTRAEAANPVACDRSRSNSIPLAEAAGDRAAEAERQLAKADQPDGWRNVDFAALAGLGGGRPCEALLAGQVDDFHRKNAGGDPPPGWRDALRVRRLAERAAVGGGPFAERSWVAVRADVTAADPRRREAEDRLFATSPDEHGRAKVLLDEAEGLYKRAAATGAEVREASRLRDDLFADLPFVGRWAAASGAADAVAAAVQAWKAAHALDAALVVPGPGLAAARKTAADAWADAVRPLTAVRGKLGSPPASQDAWLEQQHLLNCPLVAAGSRAGGLQASRTATRAWLDGNASRAGEDGAGRSQRAKEAAIAHARLAAHGFGERRLNAASEVVVGLSNLLQLETLARGLDAPDLPAGKAAELGGQLLAHARRAADGIAPGEYKDQPEAEARERDSRTTVLLAEDRTREPAEVAAALRWRVLLAGLADRTFRDHWYDEAGEPYWQLAATRYRDDADRAYRGDLPRVAALPPVPGPYSTVYPLRVAPAADTPNPLTWTSQRRRAVRFQVVADFPEAVKVGGFAVGWPAGTIDPLRWESGADRQPLGVDRAGTLDRTLVLKDLPGGDDVTTTVNPTVRAFFRGQQPSGPLEVRLNRRPEREIREPAPPRTEGAIAVRADRNVPLGQVVILLDLSGSMRQYLAKPGQSTRPDKEPTKFRAMLDELRAVLLYLPKGTPVQLRQFSAYDRDPEAAGAKPYKAIDPVVYPAAGQRAAVAWDGPENADFRNLLERLAGFYPYGFTPLVESIRKAAADGFVRQGKLAPLAKTLVVLTDGVEENEDDNLAGPGIPRPKTDREARIRGKLGRHKADLGRVFIEGVGRDVGLFVVPFGQDAFDRKLSGELFAEVSGYPVPGRLLPAVDQGKSGKLEDALLAAIFPKLLLREVGTGASPVALDRTGLPSRPDRNRTPPYSNGNGGTDLRWSPWLPAGTYTATPNLSREGVRLTLGEADTIVLGIGRDAAGEVRVRRELHADYFDPDPWKTKRQAGGRWAFTSPRPGWERQRLDAKVFVERVPAHRRVPVDDRPVDISADPPDPRGDGSELVWFDVFAADNALKPGKLTITREYSHAAPCWRLVRDGWADDKVKVQVRATVATQEDREPGDRLPDPVKLRLRVPAADAETVETVPGGGPADALEVRLAVDRRSPDGTDEPDQSWLVVRVAHPAGKPVLARLVTPGLRRADAVHRYYPPADGRADLTAAFKVPTAELRRLDFVSVNLANVGWAIDPARLDRLAVTLDPAGLGETNSAPSEITPGLPADR